MTLLKPLTALACSFMCILLSQHALAESKNEQFVLMITPQKCVALRQGLPCYAKVSLSWQGEHEDNVCLYRVANNQQLKCWESTKAGELTAQISAEDAAVFELRDAVSNDVLSTAEMRVAWVYKKKRRTVSWRLF